MEFCIKWSEDLFDNLTLKEIKQRLAGELQRNSANSSETVRQDLGKKSPLSATSTLTLSNSTKIVQNSSLKEAVNKSNYLHASAPSPSEMHGKNGQTLTNGSESSKKNATVLNHTFINISISPNSLKKKGFSFRNATKYNSMEANYFGAAVAAGIVFALLLFLIYLDCANKVTRRTKRRRNNSITPYHSLVKLTASCAFIENPLRKNGAKCKDLRGAVSHTFSGYLIPPIRNDTVISIMDSYTFYFSNNLRQKILGGWGKNSRKYWSLFIA